MTLRWIGLALLLALLLPPIARAANLQTYSTRYYTLRTDVDPALAGDLAQRMDAMYDEYTRRLIEFIPGKEMPRFVVCVFKSRKDYLQFTQNRVPNTGGVFIPGRNVLAAFLEGQGRDALRRTLQHEAFHQFAHAAVGPALPIWLNEGLAQVFEEGIYDGRQFQLGQVPPRRLRQLRSDIANGEIVDFRRFLSMTDADWERNMADRNRATAQYGQAWAMTHFLVFAADDESGAPKFRPRLIEMLRLIHTGKSGVDAFQAAFSDNYAGFQRMFLDYAATLRATELATYIEHQDVLADMLAELRTRGQRFNSIAAFRDALVRGRYRMEYKSGDVSWNTDRDVGVYFSDLRGVPLGHDRLYLDLRVGSGSPLPDLVSRPSETVMLRTRFYSAPGGKIEHELLTTGAGAPGR